MQPAQAIGARHHQQSVVGPVDQRGAVENRPLFAERVAVVQRRSRVDAGGHDGAGQVEQRRAVADGIRGSRTEDGIGAEGHR